MIIAVDGPSAAGKGTVARALAKALGYHFLDTGSLYRMVGYAMLAGGHEPGDASRAAAIAAELDPLGTPDRLLRSEEVAAAASKVSVHPEVRKNLLQLQRDFANRKPGAVLDGRDIGTVVCPKAEVKLFVTASPEVRAARRHQELLGLGQDVSLADVLADIRARDERDANRAQAPLRPAADALILDTTGMSAEEAVATALAAVARARENQ